MQRRVKVVVALLLAALGFLSYIFLSFSLQSGTYSRYLEITNSRETYDNACHLVNITQSMVPTLRNHCLSSYTTWQRFCSSDRLPDILFVIRTYSKQGAPLISALLNLVTYPNAYVLLLWTQGEPSQSILDIISFTNQVAGRTAVVLSTRRPNPNLGFQDWGYTMCDELLDDLSSSPSNVVSEFGITEPDYILFTGGDCFYTHLLFDYIVPEMIEKKNIVAFHFTQYTYGYSRVHTYFSVGGVDLGSAAIRLGWLRESGTRFIAHRTKDKYTVYNADGIFFHDLARGAGATIIPKVLFFHI